MPSLQANCAEATIVREVRWQSRQHERVYELNLGRESSALTAIAVHAILSTSSRALVAGKCD